MEPPVVGTLGVAWFHHHPEEAVMVEVGDRVVVESEKVGNVTVAAWSPP